MLYYVQASSLHLRQKTLIQRCYSNFTETETLPTYLFQAKKQDLFLLIFLTNGSFTVIENLVRAKRGEPAKEHSAFICNKQFLVP